MNILLQWDQKIFWYLNQNHSPLADALMITLSSNTAWWVVGAVATVGILLTRKRHLMALWVLALLALGATDAFCSYVIKDSVQRPRPCYEMKEVRIILPSCGGPYGFPSNHAANAFAVVTVLALGFRRTGYFALYLVAGAVAISRVYLGVHYPTDIVVGAITGILVGIIVFLLSRPLASLPWIRGVSH